MSASDEERHRVRGIDRLQAAVWPKVMKGDTKAVETAHRIVKTRVLILGLD